jgi:hypothetical protein
METLMTAKPDAEFCRAMIYDPADGGGVFVFLFRSPSDGQSEADYWYEDVAGAERHAAGGLGVEAADWQPFPDPRPGCRHDRLSSVRAESGSDEV